MQIEEEEYDETWVEPRQPHKAQLADGKRYRAKITNVDVLKDQPSYNDPTRYRDMLNYTLEIIVDGQRLVEVKFRVAKSLDDRSNYFKLLKEFGALPADYLKTGVSGKALLGRECRIKIIHSNPTENGSVFDNVDISSIEALDSVEDDANNPGLV